MGAFGRPSLKGRQPSPGLRDDPRRHGACEALRTSRKVRAGLGWSAGKLDGEGSTWRKRSHRGEKIGKDGAPKPSGRSLSRGHGHQCPVPLRGPDRGRPGGSVDLATWRSKVTLGGQIWGSRGQSPSWVDSRVNAEDFKRMTEG